jgi:BlaI family transcriptional regulator, penicillinase repressor
MLFKLRLRTGPRCRRASLAPTYVSAEPLGGGFTIRQPEGGRSPIFLIEKINSLALRPTSCVTVGNTMTGSTRASHDPAELGELERSILLIVWRRGSVTADQVREELDRHLKGSTVRTVLRRLEEKGYLGHSINDRAFIYRPAQSRQRVAGRAVKRVVDWFCEGSVEALLVGMVDSRMLGHAELQRLAERIATAQKTGPTAKKGVQ